MWWRYRLELRALLGRYIRRVSGLQCPVVRRSDELCLEHRERSPVDEFGVACVHQLLQPKGDTHPHHKMLSDLDEEEEEPVLSSPPCLVGFAMWAMTGEKKSASCVLGFFLQIAVF